MPLTDPRYRHLLIFSSLKASLSPPAKFYSFTTDSWDPLPLDSNFFYFICTKIMRQLCIQREIFMINYTILYYFTAWWWIHLSSFRLEDGILSDILFFFCLLVTKCGVFLKITNFIVGQSGAFVMGGVAYGIRAHFKQVLSLILISPGK